MAKQGSKHPHPVATENPIDTQDRARDMPFAEGARDELDADLRHRMISEAACFLHIQRGYRDGHDLDDWLEAEAEIDHMVVNPRAQPEPAVAGEAAE